MKKPGLSHLLLIGAAAGLIGISSHARADQYYVTLNAGATYPHTDQTPFDIGTKFTVGKSDIVVTALGAWGGSGQSNGSSGSDFSTLQVDTTAYLWAYADGTFTKVASVTIAKGTNATQASNVANAGWAFGKLTTPVTLKAGGTYYITSDSQQNDGYTRFSTSDLSFGSEVTFNAGAYGLPDVAPNNIQPGNSPPFGGNFRYTVGPESGVSQ